MKIAIIGRTEVLFETTELLLQSGYEIPLIVTAKEAPEYTRTAQDFELLANKIGAVFINSAKINSEESIQKIKALGEIPLAISINYSGVIAKDVIDLFSIGILNAHGGDLPRYRGNACQAWAIINKEEKVGLCIHKMIGGELDSGNIIQRAYLPINIDTRVGEVWDWFKAKVPSMMLEATKLLTKNSDYYIEAQSKSPKDALRTYPRLPEDGKINWNDTNENIICLINASSEPYSGAFCEYEGEKMIIWRAKIYEDDEIYLAIAGQIAQIDHNTGEVIVITGDGKIVLQEIEYNHIRQKPNQIIKSIRKRLK